MIIPITIHPAPTPPPQLPPALARLGHGEVVLLELQGALAVECTQPRARDGRLVGRLRVDAHGPGTDAATLVIGNHLLEGKVAALAKPLAVLTRARTTTPAATERTRVNGQDEDLEDDVDSMDNMDDPRPAAAQTGPEAGWDVLAVVKRKIVFSKRPMPITATGSVLTSGRRVD